MLITLICKPGGVLVFEYILAVGMTLAGIYFYYGARRGRVFNFAAVIGKERITWTKIVATILIVIGTLMLVSILFGLGCPPNSSTQISVQPA